jgi:hypothetical protein
MNSSVHKGRVGATSCWTEITDLVLPKSILHYLRSSRYQNRAGRLGGSRLEAGPLLVTFYNIKNVVDFRETSQPDLAIIVTQIRTDWRTALSRSDVSVREKNCEVKLSSTRELNIFIGSNETIKLLAFFGRIERNGPLIFHTLEV